MKNKAVSTLFDISGKAALVTGASGGLGRAASKGLAAAGARLVLTGRSEDKLKLLAEEIRRDGGTVEVEPGRPDDPDDAKRIVADTVKRFGGIDILLPMAGISPFHTAADIPLNDWEEIMDVNVKGTWLFCQEAGRIMIERGRGGKIILIGSTRGLLGREGCVAYSPSKGAIHMMARTLACEWGRHGINVNCIAPTLFRTEMTKWVYENEEFFQFILKRTPLGRAGEPDDLIGTLLYLASSASDYLTGQVIFLDGGFTAG